MSIEMYQRIAASIAGRIHKLAIEISKEFMVQEQFKDELPKVMSAIGSAMIAEGAECIHMLDNEKPVHDSMIASSLFMGELAYLLRHKKITQAECEELQRSFIESEQAKVDEAMKE